VISSYCWLKKVFYKKCSNYKLLFFFFTIAMQYVISVFKYVWAPTTAFRDLGILRNKNKNEDDEHFSHSAN